MRRPKICRAGHPANDSRGKRAKRDCSKDGGKKRDRSLNVSGDKDALALGESGDRRKTDENPPGRERLAALSEADQYSRRDNPQEDHPSANLGIHLLQNRRNLVQSS